MKTSRILLVAAALAAVFATSSTFAQPAGGKPKGERPAFAQGERGAKMREHLAQELNLTADQQQRIDAIHAAEREQRQAIMADESLSREQKRERGMALRQATMQQVDAVLTPEQQVKAREMRANAKERAKDRVKERRAGKDLPPKN